jgi:hypothetical protein
MLLSLLTSNFITFPIITHSIVPVTASVTATAAVTATAGRLRRREQHACQAWAAAQTGRRLYLRQAVARAFRGYWSNVLKSREARGMLQVRTGYWGREIDQWGSLYPHPTPLLTHALHPTSHTIVLLFCRVQLARLVSAQPGPHFITCMHTH